MSGLREKYLIHNKDKEVEDFDKLMDLFFKRKFHKGGDDMHYSLLRLLVLISVAPTNTSMVQEVDLPNFFKMREKWVKEEADK